MLLTAILVVVMLGLMAGMLAASLERQHAGTSLSHLVRQAEYAALSGIEWGRDLALRSGNCSAGQTAIGEFGISVSCTRETVTEGALSYDVFEIEAEARRGNYGEAGFVRRTLSARFNDR